MITNKELSYQQQMSYINGIFDIISLLNEDNCGRQFYLEELESINNNPNFRVLAFLKNKEITDLIPETNFEEEIKFVYNQYCQNYISLIRNLTNKTINEQHIAQTFHNEYIKKIFVNSIVNFFKEATNIYEAFEKANDNPHKAFFIIMNKKKYYLHFSIII